MSYFMIDIEADGPIPGDYSMIAIGAVVVEPSLSKKFYAELRPISNNCISQALEISGFTREQTLKFTPAEEVLIKFETWILENSQGRPMFISDNNGFDWMFVCWYFHHFLHRNPFGFSSNNLGSLYKGLIKNTFKNFKHLRQSNHSHNALDDAMGNAEALLKLKAEFDLKISLK